MIPYPSEVFRRTGIPGIPEMIRNSGPGGEAVGSPVYYTARVKEVHYGRLPGAPQ